MSPGTASPPTTATATPSAPAPLTPTTCICPPRRRTLPSTRSSPTSYGSRPKAARPPSDSSSTSCTETSTASSPTTGSRLPKSSCASAETTTPTAAAATDDYEEDEEDEDEETFPHGIGDTLHQAYEDDPDKLDEALTAECDLYSAYKERKEARADARTRPDDDDHDEETYPSDTLHTIYDTYKDDPDNLLEAIKRELETYPGYKERKEARAAAKARRDADSWNDDPQRRDDPEPPPPARPTPPAASTEEPEASADPPPLQYPEEPRPTPADPPTGPSYYEHEAMRKGVDTWRDPADYWVSADANPPGSYYPASGHIDFTALPRGP